MQSSYQSSVAICMKEKDQTKMNIFLMKKEKDSAPVPIATARSPESTGPLPAVAAVPPIAGNMSTCPAVAIERPRSVEPKSGQIGSTDHHGNENIRRLTIFKKAVDSRVNDQIV